MKFIVEVKVSPRWAKAFNSANRKRFGLTTDKKGRLRSLPQSERPDAGKLNDRQRSFRSSRNGVVPSKKSSRYDRRGTVTFDTYSGNYAQANKSSHDIHTMKTLKAAMKVKPKLGRSHRLEMFAKAHPDVHTAVQHMSRSPANNPDGKDPIVLYHGTSTKNIEHIDKHGLRPRSMTGNKNGWGGVQKHDHVYLTPDPNHAHSIASTVARYHNNEDNTTKHSAAVYRVHIHDRSKLHSDDDFGHNMYPVKPGARGGDRKAWFDSMRSVSAVSHKGRIPAKHVKLHSIDGKEVDPK